MGKVEAAIREKKKRRPLVWLLIPLALGGGLLFFNVQDGNRSSVNTIVKKQQSQFGAPVNSDSNTQKLSRMKNDDTKEADISLQNNITKEKSGNEKAIKTVYQKQPDKSNAFSNNKPKLSDYGRDNIVSNNIVSVSELGMKNEPSDEVNYNSLSRPVLSAEKLFADNRVQHEWKLQQDLFPGDKVESVVDSLLAKSSVAQIRVIYKWEWGITVKSGFSNNTQDIFSLLKAESAYDLYASPNAGSGGQGNIAPSRSEATFSFGAGVQVKRNISDRTSLSAGLIYAQYSNSRKTGTRVDSSRIVNNNVASYAADYFYRPGNTNEYKSTYHFWNCL
ncbi:MAG: hypothetical protein HC867_04200 [Bacteroidia bacterium]|nr:hypothetical protein [Bacteroidia bacterium]